MTLSKIATQLRQTSSKFSSQSAKLLIVIFVLGTFNSCNKNFPEKIEQEHLTSKIQDPRMDYLTDELGYSLSKLLASNSEARRVLKKEVNVKFDGDFNVLLRDLQKSEITNKKSKERVSFKEALLHYQREDLKSGEDLIEQLIQEYPDMQIAIPIGADTWDESYVPKVAIVPSNFVEFETQFVNGYDDGIPVDIDAISAPTETTVVVSMNERTGSQDIQYCQPPVVDVTLSGSTWSASNYLSWQVGENTGGELHAFYVYRKAQGEVEFTIRKILSADNTTYHDYSLIPNNTYEYKVAAVCRSKKEPPAQFSNIVIVDAPDRPAPPTEFSVEPINYNTIDVRWNYPEGEFISSANLYRYREGIDDDYNLIGSFGSDDFYYFDNDVTAGHKFTYYMQFENNLGVSEPSYDFLRTPHRDVATPISVWLDVIQVDHVAVESWIGGAPEFQISIVALNAQTLEPLAALEQGVIEAHFGEDQWVWDFDRELFTWDTSYWTELTAWKMVEYDVPSTNTTLTFNAKAKTKNAEKTGFGADLTLSTTATFKNDNKDCGVVYYSYYDPISKQLVISKLQCSDHSHTLAIIV